MRSSQGIRTIATSLCGAAVLAAPAVAAETAAERDALTAQSLFPYAKQGSAKERRSERAERHQPRRPFHPLAGKPDYGTAENAFEAARSDHIHEGQDVFAPAGTPLVAVSDAVVAEAGTDGEQGNYAYLYDPKAKRTYVYMHMIRPAAVQDRRAGPRGRAHRRGRLHRLLLGRPPALRGPRRPWHRRRGAGPPAAAQAVGSIRRLSCARPIPAPGATLGRCRVSAPGSASSS